MILKEPDIDGAMVRKNKIPILIYTPEWIQLFSNFKSRSMQKAGRASRKGKKSGARA